VATPNATAPGAMPARNTCLTFLFDDYANGPGRALLWALSLRLAGSGGGEGAKRAWCPAPPMQRHGEGRGQ
ncbi:hypothetical protein C1X87_25360, partial [Pseudomonas sp. GP01-A14]